MDSVTHVLLGAVTAQLGFRQKLGRAAPWMAGLAAVFPDIDIPIAYVLARLGHPVNQVMPSLHHRGITHSLFMVPLISLLLSWVWWKVVKRKWMTTAGPTQPPVTADSASHPLAVAARAQAARQEAKAAIGARPRFAPYYGCVLLAAVTHPLLDWCTSYGIELFSPFWRNRYALDAVPMVDVFFTPLLILTLVICWLMRRRSRGGAARATLAVGAVGFLLACSYLVAGRLFHDRVVELCDQVAGDEQVISQDAHPAIGSIFLWRAVVRTKKEWMVARLRPWYDSARVAAAWKHAPEAHNSWTIQAAKVPAANAFIAANPARIRVTYAYKDRQNIVEFQDMRYAQPADNLESLRYLRVRFDSGGKFVDAQAAEGPRRDWARMLLDMWADIWRP